MARIRSEISQKDEEFNIWKIGKYIRLSKDDGSYESESIINQRKILNEQIPKYLGDNYYIVDEYIDDGQTGTSNNKRTEFLRLIQDVKCGKVNCIITKNLSRAFRNSANQGKFLEEFIPLYNTRFISLYEPHIDTFLNPEVVHSLEVSITGLINEQYAYKTSLDVRHTFDIKRKKGEFIGAFAPYGLMKKPNDKNTLIIDETAAQIVRDIFYWFVYGGMSKRGIAKRLNEHGIPNPTAYKHSKGFNYYNPNAYNNDGLWSERTILDILTNQMYIGNMVQGKQKVISYKLHNKVKLNEQDWYIVQNTHEPIIDKETFEKAQKLHKKDTRTSPNKTNIYLFSGLLKCADCKKAMTRKSAKNIVYYSCSTYSRKSKSFCTKHTIREDVIKKAVLIAIQKQISIVYDLNKVIDEINNTKFFRKQYKNIHDLLILKQKELDKFNCLIDNLYIDWRTNEITTEEYKRIKLKFEVHIEKVKKILVNLKKEKFDLDLSHKPSSQELYLQEFLKYKNIKSLERGMLVELVDSIYVHKYGAITIQFSFDDQYKHFLELMEFNNIKLNE